MSDYSRPTCIAVIAWFWIVVGGLMLFSASVALLSFSGINNTETIRSGFSSSMPAVFKYFNLISIGQIVTGFVGLFSGIYLLKARPWSRSLLELLSWLVLIVLIGFGIFWILSFWDPSKNMHSASTILIGLFNLSLFGVPLAIIIKYLRSRVVRDFIKRTG